MKPAWASILASAAVVLAACSHSDPFPTGPRPGDGSFDQVEPIRLTYSTGDDGWPVFSADGKWLSYRFARGSADRDFCAGLLPANGGQRSEEICAWESNEHTRSDDFRALVLVGDDRMAFTRHSSTTGAAAPQEAGLYLAPLGREREGVKILGLLTMPSGGSDVWSYLIDPIDLGNGEIMVLASKVFIGQRVAFGPIDTIYRGVDIARLEVGSVPARITVVAHAPDAVAWAFDRTSNRVYFHRRYYTAPPGSGPFSVAADTIFRVPAAGGTPEAVYGREPLQDAINQQMDGFAVAGGVLYVAVQDTRVIIPQPGEPQQPPETRSRILIVAADGSTTTMHTRMSSSGGHWSRLAASPDGRRLVAGSELAGQKDLYLFRIGQ